MIQASRWTSFETISRHSSSGRGRESAALVQATDLFGTILDVAGVEVPSRRDVVSLAPYLADPATPSRRLTIFSESFLPNRGPIDPALHNRAARGIRYKLVRRGTGPDEMYDLGLDPFEQSPLDLERLTPLQAGAHARLDAAINSRRLGATTPVPVLGVPGLALLALLCGVAAVSATSGARQRQI